MTDWFKITKRSTRRVCFSYSWFSWVVAVALLAFDLGTYTAFFRKSRNGRGTREWVHFCDFLKNGCTCDKEVSNLWCSFCGAVVVVLFGSSAGAGLALCWAAGFCGWCATAVPALRPPGYQLFSLPACLPACLLVSVFVCLSVCMLVS